MTHKLKLETPFSLELGGELPNLEIAYCTFGKLNEQQNNVIWVCHALTANADVTDWWHGLFGESKTFDPKKYFIVCANNLGSSYGTTSPDFINPKTQERYGLNFPKFTIRDTAVAHSKLIEKLGLNQIQLLIGGSCGGNIALEMAYLLGDKVANLALLCSSAKETAWGIGIHEAQRLALEADQSFYTNASEVGQKGLKAARGMALLAYRTYTSIVQKQSELNDEVTENFRSASYISYQGEKLVKRFDAHCYYCLLQALDTHNIGRGRGGVEKALSEIKTKTLCIGIDSDLLIPPVEQKYMADHLANATYVEIESYYGHDGFLLEFEQIGLVIDAVLLSDRLAVKQIG